MENLLILSCIVYLYMQHQFCGWKQSPCKIKLHVVLENWFQLMISVDTGPLAFYNFFAHFFFLTLSAPRMMGQLINRDWLHDQTTHLNALTPSWLLHGHRHFVPVRGLLPVNTAGDKNSYAVTQHNQMPHTYVYIWQIPLPKIYCMLYRDCSQSVEWHVVKVSLCWKNASSLLLIFVSTWENLLYSRNTFG